MAILFEDYLTEVRQDVPGCPENTMIQAVRNACIELCEKSLIWRENLAVTDVVQGTDKYQLVSADTEAAIHYPIHVAYNETALSPKTEEELDILDYAWRTADENVPTFYLMEAAGLLWLNRKPNASILGGLVVRVSIKPAADSTGAEDFIYNDWHEAIAHGAKRRLMEVAGKKWSNQKQSLYHGAKFNFYINQALAKATKGNVKTSTTVQIPAW